MDKRVLELAVEALEEKRKAISNEIAELTSMLAAEGKTRRHPSPPKKSGRIRSAAQRRALSTRMKEIWAARKARARKPKGAAAAKPKIAQNNAANLARAEKMRAYWAGRKAQK